MEGLEMDAHYIQVFKSHLLPPLGQVMKNAADLSVIERCKAIKFLADGSLALTARGAEWSAALGDELLRSVDETTTEGVSPQSNRSSRSSQIGKKKSSAKAKIAGRSHRLVSRFQRVKARRILKRREVLDSRVKTLKGLVPGGSQMNSSVLLSEAADYMMFLKFQVAVMQSLAGAIEKQ